jgi:DNA polymerase-3 subunit epsilon
MRNHTTGLRPWINLIKIMMIASTSSRWMKPPRVYDVTTPASHRTRRIMAIVESINWLINVATSTFTVIDDRPKLNLQLLFNYTILTSFYKYSHVIKYVHVIGRDIFEKPLAIIDVETTGASPVYDRILEIAIIRIEQGKVTETFTSVIDPEKHIPDTIMSLTGITEGELKRAPTFSDISHDVHNLIAGCILVAHNVRFDYGFVKNEFKRLGVKYTAECFCTVKLSRALFPEYSKHDLSTIIDRFDFDCPARHRALADARVLVDFLNYCQSTFPIDTLQQTVAKILKRSFLPVGVPTQVIEALPKRAGVYIFYGENGEKLYIGKSINIYSRVLSHFSDDHRSGKEMRLAQEVRDIETVETPGELSALLMESHLIKKDQPLYNRMLRRTQKLVVLTEQINDLGYKEALLSRLDPQEVDVLDKIIAIFKTKGQAAQWLRDQTIEHALCPRLLGLETTKQCFNYQLGKCNGACTGIEKPEVYNTRFDLAFSQRKLKAWPFSGPILITENSEKNSGVGFIVNDWRLEGSFVYDETGSRPFLPEDYVFDYDSYKILSRYVLQQPKAQIKMLSHVQSKSLLDRIY